MMPHRQIPELLKDHRHLPWEQHPRFPRVRFKALVKGTENPLLSVGMVRIPPGAAIGIHTHAHEVETIYALAGEGVFTLGEREVVFAAGQIVSVPIAMAHGLRNSSDSDVELLTIFTPPLF